MSIIKERKRISIPHNIIYNVMYSQLYCQKRAEMDHYQDKKQVMSTFDLFNVFWRKCVAIWQSRLRIYFVYT